MQGYEDEMGDGKLSSVWSPKQIYWASREVQTHSRPEKASGLGRRRLSHSGSKLT